MELAIYLVLFGALINILGSLAYAKCVLNGKAKPNRVTWLLWSIAPFIGAFAAFSSGVTWAAVPVLVAGLSPFIIFTSSFLNKKAYWKLTKFDYVCGGLSLLALILWGVTREPLVALILAIMADALAAVPTIKKSWSHPESEAPFAYAAGGFNALTSFFVIKTWAFSEYAFPAYLVVLCFGLVLLIYRRKIFNK